MTSRMWLGGWRSWIGGEWRGGCCGCGRSGGGRGWRGGWSEVGSEYGRAGVGGVLNGWMDAGVIIDMFRGEDTFELNWSPSIQIVGGNFSEGNYIHRGG